MTGEVAAIRENGASSGVGVLASYEYDNLGRRKGITRGNGTTTSFDYDGMSRLSALIHNIGGTALDVSSSFAFRRSSVPGRTSGLKMSQRWRRSIVTAIQ